MEKAKKQERLNANGADRVKLSQSVKTKLVFLVIIAMVVLGISVSVIYVTNVKRHLLQTNENYLYDLAVAYGIEVKDQIDVIGYNTATNYNNLANSLGGVGLTDVESSYAYVVSEDGTMLYHPTKEKVGQPVENEVVKGIVEKLQAGETVEPAVVQYMFRGEPKYAAYYVTERGHCILVISADEKEILQSVNQVIIIGTICTLICVLLFSIIAYAIVHITVSPIKKVTQVVGRLAQMDFTEIEGQDKLVRRTDETGMMSRAVAELRAQLVRVVEDLQSHSKQLFQSSEALQNHATETAGTVEQVEKAVSEISDGATSQADETQKATENVILMGNMVEETNQEVRNLMDNADNMRKASDEASSTLSDLEKINQQAKDAIDVIYEQTNTTNESALKIREATSLITSIAEETNLLSLNASIEAARAGEQGRGFAVVASQIQKLAEQSNDSARQIEAIIDSLISDSQKAVETMGEVKEIMNSQNENVEKTNSIFTQVKEGISNSIDGVNKIADKTQKLDEARVNVVDVVQNLTAIAQENAASTEETSASVTEVSNIIYSISENATQLKEVANGLEENMNIFKI